MLAYDSEDGIQLMARWPSSRRRRIPHQSMPEIRLSEVGFFLSAIYTARLGLHGQKA